MIAIHGHQARNSRRTLLLAVAARIALGLGALASSAAASAVLPDEGAAREAARPPSPGRS
jgi:hypothetical protein